MKLKIGEHYANATYNVTPKSNVSKEVTLRSGCSTSAGLVRMVLSLIKEGNGEEIGNLEFTGMEGDKETSQAVTELVELYNTARNNPNP